MRARTALLTAGFAVLLGLAAVPAANAGDVRVPCRDLTTPSEGCPAIDPVETGGIGDASDVGLLLSNSELVLPGMTLRINRPVKLRRADTVL